MDILADYQNDIEISNSSRMFEDPVKMVEHGKASLTKPASKNSTNLSHSKK